MHICIKSAMLVESAQGIWAGKNIYDYGLFYTFIAYRGLQCGLHTMAENRQASEFWRQAQVLPGIQCLGCGGFSWMRIDHFGGFLCSTRVAGFMCRDRSFFSSSVRRNSATRLPSWI